MRKALIYLVCLLIFASSVYSLGIAPAKTTMDFSSGTTKQGAMRIIVDEVPAKVLLTTEGELGKYIKLQSSNLILEETETWVNFDVNLPEELPPGERRGSILVLQVPTIENTDVVMAAPAVMHQVRVNVPYPGKYVTGKMFITNVNVKQPMLFTIALANFGKEEVKSAKATIIIKGPTNEQIAVLHTDPIHLSAGQEDKLLVTWQTDNAGSFVAECTVEYDGKIINFNENFNVGNIEVEIERITINDFRLGQIAKIDIHLLNKWNQALKVDGRVEIFKDNSLVSTFNTIPVDILSGSTSVMNAYWNTQDVQTGEYTVSVKAKYDGKTSEKTFTTYVGADSISIKTPTGEVVKKAGSQNIVLLSVLVFVLIIVNIFLFIFINKKLKQPPASGK
jgi:hypothetical protein